MRLAKESGAEQREAVGQSCALIQHKDAETQRRKGRISVCVTASLRFCVGTLFSGCHSCEFVRSSMDHQTALAWNSVVECSSSSDIKFRQFAVTPEGKQVSKDVLQLYEARRLGKVRVCAELIRLADVFAMF